jgi:hypothetical protein
MPGKPLNLVFSIPRNGASRVSPTRTTIVLAFDKNVVNDTVWENNKNQIRLFRGTTRVSINVTRIPDTVDFNMRGRIFVKPVNGLRPSSSYRLVILPNLMSKAGETLGKTVTIRFKTGPAAEE